MTEIDLTHAGAELRPLSELDERQVWAMVEASPDGMLLADEYGTILSVNAQIETMFGYDRAALLGRPIEELLPERHRQVHTAHRTRYRARPEVRAMGSGLKLAGQHSDGTEFPVEVSLSPVNGPDGLQVVATVRDVSDRMAVEAHTHAVLHTIDETEDGVFMFTPETLAFTYLNRGAVTQLGYTQDELLTMTPLHIKPEFTEATFRELLEPLLADKITSRTFTTVHRRKDGADRPVEIILQYPPAAEPGQARMLVALVRDISERLETEREVLDQQARLRVLEDRERLAQDLHDLVIQRLFAAGMGLQSVHSLITDTAARERVNETVTQIDATIAELRDAIFRLNNPTQATLADRLAEVIDDAETKLGYRPDLSIAGDLESISERVAEELLPTITEALSNVARHANASTTHITLTATDDQVELTVVDNGDGYQPIGGTGNGLSNLRDRAKRLEGTMTITANSDSGTTLTWTAPK